MPLAAPATGGIQAKIGRMPLFRVTTESGGVVAIVPPDGLKNTHKSAENSLNRPEALVSSDLDRVSAGACR
jgi:hypothetical protein